MKILFLVTFLIQWGVTRVLSRDLTLMIQQIRSGHSHHKPNKKCNSEKHERNFNQCSNTGKTKGHMSLALSLRGWHCLCGFIERSIKEKVGGSHSWRFFSTAKAGDLDQVWCVHYYLRIGRALWESFCCLGGSFDTLQDIYQIMCGLIKIRSCSWNPRLHRGKEMGTKWRQRWQVFNPAFSHHTTFIGKVNSLSACYRGTVFVNILNTFKTSSSSYLLWLQNNQSFPKSVEF